MDGARGAADAFGSLDAERYLEMGKRDAFAERAKVT
jgi:hypothetical protein